MNSIEEKVLCFFREQYPLDAEDILPESRFKQDLDIDSLDLVDLRMQIEVAFGVRIELIEFASMKRVRDLVDYLVQHEAIKNQ